MVYHLAVVGDPMAGKTTLVNTVKTGKYTGESAKVKEPSASSSSMDEFFGMRRGTSDEQHSFSIEIDGKKHDLTVTDGGRAQTGGRMDMTWRTIPQQFNKANAIVVCFDASSPNGLRRSFRLLQMAQRDAGIYKTPVFLVGLKADERLKSLPFEDSQREANEHLCDSYYECSAKTGEGVNELFSAIIHELDAIKEREGNVPTVAPFQERQAEYQKQNKARAAQPPTQMKRLPSTPQQPPSSPSAPPAPVSSFSSLSSSNELKKPMPVMPTTVKGGARPAKEASPCVIQ